MESGKEEREKGEAWWTTPGVFPTCQRLRFSEEFKEERWFMVSIQTNAGLVLSACTLPLLGIRLPLQNHSWLKPDETDNHCHCGLKSKSQWEHFHSCTVGSDLLSSCLPLLSREVSVILLMTQMIRCLHQSVNGSSQSMHSLILILTGLMKTYWSDLVFLSRDSFYYTVVDTGVIHDTAMVYENRFNPPDWLLMKT